MSTAYSMSSWNITIPAIWVKWLLSWPKAVEVPHYSFLPHCGGKQPSWIEFLICHDHGRSSPYQYLNPPVRCVVHHILMRRKSQSNTVSFAVTSLLRDQVAPRTFFFDLWVIEFRNALALLHWLAHISLQTLLLNLVSMDVFCQGSTFL